MTDERTARLEYLIARRWARLLIEPYVLRGDDPKHLKHSYLGCSGPDMPMASISGYARGKGYNNDFIVVSGMEKLGRSPTEHVFRFWDIYRDITAPNHAPQQLKIF